MLTVCLRTHAQIESEQWRRQPPCDCDNCRDYRAGTLWEQQNRRYATDEEASASADRVMVRHHKSLERLAKS